MKELKALYIIVNAGFSAEVEQAGQRSLQAISAYISREQITAAAWQVFQGTMNVEDALQQLL